MGKFFIYSFWQGVCVYQIVGTLISIRGYRESFFIYKLISNREGQVYSFKPDLFALIYDFYHFILFGGNFAEYGEIS